MNLVFHACILLMLANALFATHLPCQKAPSMRPHTPRPSSSPAIGPTPSSPRGHPDSCCGSFPYDSNIKMCCFGTVIDTKQKKCCIAGSPVPIAARCDCYPKSSWIYEQILVVKRLEIKFGTLVELLDTAKQRVAPIVKQRLTMVEELDAKVEELFNTFLSMINLTRNENPEEIQNIINLILFRNSMEEEDESTATTETPSPVIKSATEEVEIEEDEDKKSINFKSIAESLIKQQEFINYLLTGQNKKISPKPSLVERDRQEIELLVMQRVEAIPASTYAEIDRIVVRRAVLLKNLNRRNANLEILRRRLSAIERLLAIAEVDYKLMLSTSRFFEVAWDEALSLETIAKEEDKEIKEYWDEYREEYGESRITTTTFPRGEEEEVVTPKRLIISNIDPSEHGAEPLNDPEGEQLSLSQIEYIQESEEIFDTVTTESPEREFTEYPEFETENQESDEVSEEEDGPGCDVRIMQQFMKDVSYRSDLLTADMSLILNANRTVNAIEELTEKHLEQFQITKTELAFSKLTKPPNDFVTNTNYQQEFEKLFELVNQIQVR